MGSVEEIALKLGIKTGDLKSAMADAGVTIKKFKKDSEDGGDGFAKSLGNAKKGVEMFKSVLAGAGLVGILKSIFQSAVEYAENYTGALDDNVAATLRVRDAQKDLQNLIGKAGATIIGWMDKAGVAVGALVYGFDAAADALNAMDAEAKKAFDDARAKKLLEATAKYEKARRDAAIAALDDNGKINLLAAEYVKLLEEQAKLKKGSIEWIEKATLAEAKGAELRKQDAETRKKEAEDLKKRTDEATAAREKAKKEEDDELKKRALSNTEELEMFALQQKNAAMLTKAERERLAVLTLQKEEKWVQQDIENLIEKKITDGLTPAETKRLEELIKQEKKLGDQLDKKAALARATLESQLPAEQAVTSEMERQKAIQEEMAAREAQIERSRHGTVTQTGDVRNLNDTQLEGLITKLGRDLEAVKSTNMNGPLGYTPIEQLLLQQNLDAAKKEVNARRDFANTQRAFGDQYAQRTYAPDDYARLAQLFNPDQAKKDSNNLAAVASGLQNLFPDKFSGALR